jgi:methionyl-tRNA formyltransferase
MKEHISTIFSATNGALPETPRGPIEGAQFNDLLSITSVDEGEIIRYYRMVVQLLRQIKAFNPWPVSYSFIKGKHFRIWDAELNNHDNLRHSPGKIVEVRGKDILVSTGEKMLALTQVQLEGRKKIAAGEFARGFDCQGITLGC